jgi:LysM repeat protein
LSNLRRRFKGDMLLALASYNCGEGRVESAMAANRSAELPTDYWSLSLPEETQAYVPRMLALSAILRNAAGHRVTLRPIPNRPYVAKIKFEQIMPLEDVSRLANLTPEKFQYLNPGFTKGIVGLDGPHQLLIPQGNVAEFYRNLDAFLHPAAPEVPGFVLVNKVVDFVPLAPGPNIYAEFQSTDSSLSGKAAVPSPGVASLEGAGGLGPAGDPAQRAASEPEPVRPPMISLGPGNLTRKQRQSAVIYTHKVKPGETVEKIAVYYGVDSKAIRSLAKSKKSKRVKPGDEVIIPLDDAVPVDLLSVARSSASRV